MKKHLLIISGVVVAAFLVLFSLNAAIDKPNKYKNGFQRKFVKRNISEIKRAPFEVTLLKICEIHTDSIFFSSTNPGKLYLSNNALTKWDTINLELPNIPKLESNFYTFIKYPEVFILGGNARCFIQKNLITKKIKIVKITTNGVFTKVVQLNPATYMMQVIDSLTLIAQFKKINIENETALNENGLSPKIGDAGFTYDGQLNYSPSENLLVFIPFYNNNILAFDSNLNLLYKGHTIDTVNTPKRQFLKTGNSVTQSEPPITVNKQDWIFGKYLFINSKLKADSEDASIFEKSLVIDRYDVANGKYHDSFYLPFFRGEKLIGFHMLDNDHILVLYDRLLIKYYVEGL